MFKKIYILFFYLFLCSGWLFPHVGWAQKPSVSSLIVWANNGEDKVVRSDLRARDGKDVRNSVWDGKKVHIFGAKNEVVAFNLILEAGATDVQNLSIKFNRLEGPKGAVIASKEVSKKDVFDYRERNIELFYVRYLQIKGLSRLAYEPSYDERHVPERLRLPYKLPKGRSKGKFIDRPDANKFYPDIAVPMEAVKQFNIQKGNNQSVWVDIYIPKNAAAGKYQGTVKGYIANTKIIEIPVELTVMPFQLPDVPTAKTMVYFSQPDIDGRYYGRKWPDMSKATILQQKKRNYVWNAHQLVAHRHKLSLIDEGLDIQTDRLKGWLPLKNAQWMSVLTGKLFTAEYGYDGPGVGVSGGIYSIGTYGAWRSKWDSKKKESLWENSDKWVNWFETVLPNVDYFLYLLDEPKADKYAEVEKWAEWIKSNPNKGKRLKTLVTTSIVNIEKYMPAVDIGFTMWGDKQVWEPVVKDYLKKGKEYWAYNGQRPMTGSFATEDDGVALRVIGWTQFKHKIGRWFFWHSTQYQNSSHVSLENNVFQTAWTFGRKNEKYHMKYGETGNGYNNGDGVLFYPGTDKQFPEDSYGLWGPIASLRMKHWRRGIQDHDYLTMASKINPQEVNKIVNTMIPKVLWEVGVTSHKDPTYVHTNISWTTNPDKWEEMRRRLAGIIINGKTK